MRAVRFHAGVFLVVALVTTAVATASASQGEDLPALEERMLTLLNESRSGEDNRLGSSAPLVAHEGLRERAREHAVYMSQKGRLSHDQLRRRVYTAQPDPPEDNAAPDDGFNGAYCENAGWFRGSGPQPEDRIVRTLLDQFRDSEPHRRCMFDEYGGRFSVAGVGFHEVEHGDGGFTVWMSMIIVRDHSMPGTAPAPEAVPEPSPEPEIPDEPAPEPTPIPAPTPAVEEPAVEEPEPYIEEPEPLCSPDRGRAACLALIVGPSVLELGLA